MVKVILDMPKMVDAFLKGQRGQISSPLLFINQFRSFLYF